jgi:hypothetical protein
MTAACGTEPAYRAHLANGEDCEACRTAHNARARQDDKKRARARAQSRALKALARCFPIEYNALYQQELAKEEAASDSTDQQAAA